jgi:replication-associated recombination protein RarA
MSGPPQTRRGYEVFECISALQKAVRRSQVDEAIYWTVELNESGYGKWAWRRLRVIQSEDIGQAEPGLAADIRALYENWLQDRKVSRDNPDGLNTVADLYLVQAAILCATAKKSRLVDWALTWHKSDWVERRRIEDYSLDGHTKRGKAMGRGMQFFLDESTKLADFDGDLAELEAEYRAEVQQTVNGEVREGRPKNPWGPPRSRRNGESWLPAPAARVIDAKEKR